MSAYGLPEDKAFDIVEAQSIGALRVLLENAGYGYVHSVRRWVQAS